jgi:predicted nucleic acid-binding protein
MTAATYLIDTSALVRILREPTRTAWKKPLEEGIIARCPVTGIEFLFCETIAELTGRRTQWLAPPGTL